MLTKIAFIAFLLLSLSAFPTEKVEVIDAPACEKEASQCEPRNCFDQCIKEGEDPLECPYYCYDHV